MITKVDDIIEVMSEYAAPYLFIGSGFSRRYIDTPSWEALLDRIAQEHDINFGLLMLDCRDETNSKRINFPKLGSILNKELERKKVEQDPKYDFRNITPIKEEIAKVFASAHNKADYTSEEIKLFKSILIKTSGIITTNYDLLLEELTKELDFQSFVGQSSLIQSNLIFSDEIYKIHGCVTERESIIITNEDYSKFENRQKYILGKLTVIFAEFPLIFLGYSLEDENIKGILKDLMVSLSYEELKKVSKKWLFVEYKEGENELLLSEKRIELENGNRLIFNCIQTDNYSELYKKLMKINFTVPAQRKVIKYIKKIIAEYEFKPNSKIYVQSSENIDEVIDAFEQGGQVSLSLGTTSEFLNVSYFELMKDVVCESNSTYKKETSGFTENYKKTVRGTYFPRYKYFSESELQQNGIDVISLEDFNWAMVKSINNSYKDSNDLSKKLQYWLKEIFQNKNINLEELKSFLIDIFDQRTSLDEVRKDYSLKYDTDLKKVVTAYDILTYK